MIRLVEYKRGVASSLGEKLSLAFPNLREDVWVNYGNGTLEVPRRITLVLNRAEAVRLSTDKPAALATLRLHDDGLFVVPSVLEACILVKPRNHRGGKGQILVEGPKGTHYAEEFVPCSHEWRVHVVGDRTCARIKTGGTGKIRNRQYGWVFTVADEVPQAIRDAAKEAVRLLSLDFGAVDIGDRGRRQPPVVYEVNTAPRLQVDVVLEWYAGAFKRLIERRLG